jgi:hypothetical protein
MKNTILLGIFLAFGSMLSAKENVQTSISTSNDFSKKQSNVILKKIILFTQYKYTLRTVCGTLFTTIYDDQFETPECLYTEWEMHNQESCGHASYENGMV